MKVYSGCPLKMPLIWRWRSAVKDLPVHASFPSCPHIKTALLFNWRHRYSRKKHCILSFPKPTRSDSNKGEAYLKIHLILMWPERFFTHWHSCRQEGNPLVNRKMITKVSVLSLLFDQKSWPFIDRFAIIDSFHLIILNNHLQAIKADYKWMGYHKCVVTSYREYIVFF